MDAGCLKFAGRVTVNWAENIHDDSRDFQIFQRFDKDLPGSFNSIKILIYIYIRSCRGSLLVTRSNELPSGIYIYRKDMEE